MSNFLEDNGLTKENIEQAESSAVGKVFEPLPSGVYSGEVKEVISYKNQWDGEQLSFIVAVKDDKGEERKLSFRQDIGKTLKDGSVNHGYAGRLKQFAHATSTALEDLMTGEATKIKSFGKEHDGKTVKGFTGKTVKALVRLTNDINKEEGANFKYSNDLSGVVAPDGTQADGENAAEMFLETVKKTPIFTIEGKSKKGTTATQATTTASGADINSMI